ncbi:hypothetical protein EVA_05090 [gut metagenome]|uniref:Uncharacterized protein n=1 Tax=gut metagenome TaxID=749906 RepID=J9GH67_9ZZZZ
MQGHSLLDTDFTDGDTQFFHQVQRISISTVGCTKARHGHTDNASAIALEAIESMNGNQQGERRIQASTDTNHYGTRLRMFDATSQSFTLHTEDFLATLIKQSGITGNERMGINLTGQNKGDIGHIGFQFDFLSRQHAFRKSRCGEGRIASSVSTQPLDIDFAINYLLLHGETLRFSNDIAILANEGTATKHQVLRTFTITTAGIHISCNQTSTLALYQTAHIIGLANQVVAGTQIENDVSTNQCQTVAGRHRRPKVLTDFYTKGAMRSRKK